MTFTDLHAKVREFRHDAKEEYDFIRDFVSNNNKEAELKLRLKESKAHGEKLLKDLTDEIMAVESRIYVKRQPYLTHVSI